MMKLPLLEVPIKDQKEKLPKFTERDGTFKSKNYQKPKLTECHFKSLLNQVYVSSLNLNLIKIDKTYLKEKLLQLVGVKEKEINTLLNLSKKRLIEIIYTSECGAMALIVGRYRAVLIHPTPIIPPGTPKTSVPSNTFYKSEIRSLHVSTPSAILTPGPELTGMSSNCMAIALNAGMGTFAHLGFFLGWR